MNFNSVIDRALSEHLGSGIFSKKDNGKYSIFLPVTNTGEIGSAPDQIEKTVIGNMARSYIQGRKDSPQQTLTYFVHRDNLRIIEKNKNKTIEFLRVFPDFSAIKYSGRIDRSINDGTLDSAEQGTLSITVTVPEEVVDDCFALIEDTAIFTNDIPEVVHTKVGAEDTIVNVSVNPANATVTATSETSGVATASYEAGKVTIKPVTEGTSVVTLTTSAEGYAGWNRTIFVIVDAEE